MGLFRFLFGKKDTIPKGGFKAPMWDYDIDKGHLVGGDYHIHLKKLNNGRYHRTNIVFSRRENNIYAYDHCERSTKIKIKLSKIITRSMLKELENINLFHQFKKNVPWRTNIPGKSIFIKKI